MTSNCHLFVVLVTLQALGRSAAWTHSHRPWTSSQRCFAEPIGGGDFGASAVSSTCGMPMAIPASDHAGEPGGTPIFQRLLAEAPTTAIRSLTDASAAPPPAPTTATRLLTDASPAAPTTATRRLLTGASAARVTATAAGARGAAQRFLYRKVEVATGPPGAELTPTQEVRFLLFCQGS